MSLISQIETEEVYKYANTSLRNSGMFYSFGLTSVLNWNLSLSQSFLYYNQNILYPDIYSGTKEIGINEKQYYGKLSYVPFDNVIIKTAYHYLNLNFDTSKYTTDIGFLALKYYSGSLDFQFSFSYGKFINEIQRQFSVQAGFYPFGNMNLYYILACINSNRNSQNKINVSSTLGFKVFDYLWIEGNYTSNDIINYLENDILYVYNSMDQGIYKISGTLISPITSNINIKLGFLYEPKKLAFTKEDTYLLKSIYGGLSWKL